MRWLALLAALAVLALAPAAFAEPSVHVVQPGQTLGKIAQRYNVTIDALCATNRISRRDPIRPGQKLRIPGRGGAPKPAPPAAADKPPAAETVGPDGMRTIQVPGSGPAYFYEPIGSGRLGLKPVLVYLHGRGGNPKRDCRRWAPVARRLGWLACPSGPGAQGDGRGWNNNWVLGQRAAVGTVQALRDKYGRRVQLWGNTLIGFSEGAFVALNVGAREARTFNRWLILAADNDYWGGPGLEAMRSSAGTIRRVYLITGQQDQVHEATFQVRDWLKGAGIDTRLSTPPDLGHEVALERKEALYRAALGWLDRGDGPSGKASKSVAKRSQAGGRER
jgi:hypothetical protein